MRDIKRGRALLEAYVVVVLRPVQGSKITNFTSRSNLSTLQILSAMGAGTSPTQMDKAGIGAAQIFPV